MRKEKRIVAILLSAIMLVSLMACGKTKEPKEVLDEMTTEIGNAPAVSFSVSTTVEDEQSSDKFALAASGTISKDAGATLEINAKINDESVAVTDALLTADKTLYVNINKMLFFLNRPEVSGALDAPTDDEEIDPGFSLGLSSVMDMLSGLNLPTYLKLPLEESEESDSGSLVDIPNVDEYKPVGDALKDIYNELVADKEIFTYSSKDKVVNIVINEATIDKVTSSMSYYFSPNPEKAEIFFGTIVPLLPADTVENIYSDLRIELNTDENGELYFGYTDFIREKMEDIKAFVADHPYTVKDIIKNRMTECLTSLVPETLNVKIDTKNKYTITVSREKEDKNETLATVAITPLEKASDMAQEPSDSAGIEDIIGQLFAGFAFEDGEDSSLTD